MADRTVKVRLTAQVQEYIEGMEKATKATRETGSEAEKLAAQRDAFNMLGASALVMGTAAAAGVGLAVSKWADFDQAMSNVQAATHESEANMKLLGDAALEAGARTVFSAEESANAIEELAKAGVSTADILNGGLDGALDLAAAGGLGVAEAAGIAATALKTFNLEGSDMSHVADLLAAGAGKAMGDVTDLSAALNQSAMVANATGLSIEETTGTLAAFASQGLLGSDAGTSFKSMLQSLTPTSAKARDTMNELGISAYDAQGNFVGMAEFAGNLQAGLKDLTVEQQQAALKTIFGSDAIRAATVLYSEGEEGIREWTDAVNDQGYAAETAAARLDNLKGDLEALGGALDTALIQTGSAANDVLRGMVQAVSAAVDVYNELPEPLQGAALAAGILTAAVGVLGGGALLVVPQIGAFKTALTTLEITSGRAMSALSGIGGFLSGPWGIALMAAAGVATVLVGEKQKMVTNSKELAETLDSETGAVTENSTAWAANKLEQEGILEMSKRLGISSKDMTDAWLGNEDAMKRVNGELDKWVNNADFRKENGDWDGWSNDLATVQGALEGSNTMLTEAKEKHDRLKEATEGSGDAAATAAGQTETQVSALDELNAKATETEDAVAALAAEIAGFGAAQFDLRNANRSLEESYDSLNALLEENGANFDITSEEGRKVESAMDDVAKATNVAAAAIGEAGGSQEDINAKLVEGKSALIDILAPYMESRDAAAAYVDQLDLISPEKVSEIIADAEKAKKDLDEYQAKLDALTPEKVVKIDADAADAFEGIEGVEVVKIDDKTAYVYGENADAQAKIDAIIAKGIPGKTSNIDANDDGFWAAWWRIQQAQIADKVVNIVENVTKTVTGLSENAVGGLYAYANGGLESYAGGGFGSGIYSGGAPLYKLAEQETGWEAFISGKPSERDRNRQIWVDAGERLGMSAGGSPNISVKVQNPWGSGYLLGKVVEVVNDGIDASLEQQAQANRKAGQ